jgi:hypothetical protein
MINITALLANSTILFACDSDGWLNVGPANRWSSVVVPSISVDLNRSPEMITKNDVLSDLELCIEGQNVGCSSLTSSIPLVKMTPPWKSNGVSRLSLWLQHKSAPSMSPVNNVTVYSWIDHEAAAVELRRRISWCSMNPSICDLQNLQGHISIAEARNRRQKKDIRSATLEV